MRLHPVPGVVLLAAALAACGPAAIAVSSTPPSASPTQTVTAPPVLAVITPEAAIAAPNVGGLAFDGSTMWVFSGEGGGAISRIDPATNAISVPVSVDHGAYDGGSAVNRAALWIGNFDTNLVSRLDPATLKVVATIPVGANPDGITVTDGAVWVANHRGGTVTRIDPATNKVVATITVGKTGPGGPHAIAFGLGSLWVSAGNAGNIDTASGGTVVRIDPATNAIQATIQIPPLGSACGGFAFSEVAVWMDSCGDQRTLVRIDPSTNEAVTAIDLGGYGCCPVLIDGVPWLTIAGIRDTDPGRLLRIDPASNTVDRIVSLGDAFRGGGLLLAAGSVWITDWANEQVLRFPVAALSR